MKYTPTLLFAFLLLVVGTTTAQQANQLHLKTGTYTLPENIQSLQQETPLFAREVVSNRYYRLLQFAEMPDHATLKALRDQDVQLLEYLSAQTYVASLPTQYDLRRLQGYGVRGVHQIEKSMKVTPDISMPDGWRGVGDDIDAMLVYHKDIPQPMVQAFCEHDGIKLLEFNGYNSVMKVRLPYYRLAEIAELPYVAFIDNVPGPDIPDDLNGRAMHRTSAIDVDYGIGRHYNGEGVSVLTRDDGRIGPHIDFTGRLDQTYCGPSRGSHGDGVSGIFAGAGNLDPANKGMASGAMLYVMDYHASFLDRTMDLFFEKDVIVTNSSYSNDCNVGYTSSTYTVDQQLYDNPTLMHVFSAGNSNGQDCAYGAGENWGNITGGHKQAKNCLTTANLFSDETLVPSSSRGPAHDGRIKPDISAHGQNQVSTDPDNTYDPFGGTSAAAPGIAGVTAMLHHAYSDLNGGERANAALLKAMMLNTANDLGNKGPDYKFGWGQVNALRVVQTMEENRYMKATVLAGQTNTHTIDIPAGVTQARIMTYWMDPPAAVNARKALVNDLNTRVTANGDIHMPWVLNPTPDSTILDTPADKGVDDLNNMEQVAIENPAAGTYTLEVEGTTVPFGEREYYVVWEFRTDEITIIYPMGGERLIPGESMKIYWDAEDGADPFVVSFSINNGNNWAQLGGVNGSTNVYDWEVPNVYVGEVLIRVARGGVFDISDSPVNVAPVPENIAVGNVCHNSVELNWDAINGATSYDVYQLGKKYMEIVATPTTNTLTLPISDPSGEMWFAVAANFANNLKGRRSVAVSHSGGLKDCPAEHNVSLISINEPDDGIRIDCQNFSEAISVTVKNNGTTVASSISAGYRIDGGTEVVEAINGLLAPGDSIIYTFNEQVSIDQTGIYELEMWSSIAEELYPFDDTMSTELTIYAGVGEPLDLVEDFEGLGFPSNFWTIENIDSQDTWSLIFTTGSDGLFTYAASLRYRFFDGDRGTEDALSTIPIDMSEATDSLYLFFDMAYSDNSADEDGLRIEVSTNCGESFDHVIFEEFGEDLETTSVSGSLFPTRADQWRVIGVDLSEFVGEDNVIVRFVGIHDTGNNLYIDNINIRKASLTVPKADFEASADEVCIFESLTFTNKSEGELLSYEWRFGLGANPPSASGVGPFTVSYQLPRTETVSLIARNPVGADTITKTYNVVRNPTGDYSFDDAEGTVNVTSSGNPTYGHFWDFGDGNTSTAVNPTHRFALPGDYQVVLTISNACGDHVVTKEITITTVGIFDPEDLQSVQVLPNPNEGHFDLLLQSASSQELDIRLMDTKGVLIAQQTYTTQAGQNSLRFEENRLPAGLYFLQLNDGKRTRSLKVIIK